MAAKQDEKHPFESTYAPDVFITHAQWLTERLFERRAAVNKVNLPIKFWNLPKWKKEFQGQVQAASKLLQDFTLEEIVRAVNDFRGKKSLSFRVGWFRKLVVSLRRDPPIVPEVEIVVEADVPPAPTKLRTPFIQNKSRLSQLKEYDGKEKRD